MGFKRYWVEKIDENKEILPVAKVILKTNNKGKAIRKLATLSDLAFVWDNITREKVKANYRYNQNV